MWNYISYDELYHHGIKGQKWGVRRYQYKDGTLTAEGRRHYGYGESKKRYSGGDLDDDHTLTKQDRNLRALKKGLGVALKVARNPQAALIDATVGAVKGSIGVAKENRAEKKHEQNTNIDEKTGLKLRNNLNDNPDKDLKNVNPGYKNFSDNTKHNCALCTTAVELRRRGYDVVANKADTGYTRDIYSKMFKGAKLEHVDLGERSSAKARFENITNKVTSQLSQQGPGARGALLVSWKQSNGAGHAIAYEVDKKGRVIIRDGQTNTVYRNPNKILSKCNGADYVRLDNCEIVPSEVKKAVH